VALAGNPNTGKSTVFNALTGLRQHTGNWPGKTVTRAEGGFSLDDRRYKLVDLPGTYSLLSASHDEEVARDFILFGRPDVTVIVVDATRLERNLNLVLQVLAITDRVVVCLNLIDEAENHGIEIDAARLSRDLGVPVVATAARSRQGIPDLLAAIRGVACGEVVSQPHRIEQRSPALERAVGLVAKHLDGVYPDLPNREWVALRLLDGDEHVREAVLRGDLGHSGAHGELAEGAEGAEANGATTSVDEASARRIIDEASALRWEIGRDFHRELMESIYADAVRIASAATTFRSGTTRAARFNRALDRVLTDRRTGIPIMILLLGLVLWMTVEGANVPSGWLASLLIDTIHPALGSFAAWIGMPWWLDGLLFDGIYLSTAWVVSVMLPPMAIFFPLFTLLEDFGYLPRVAFNLDHLFKRVGGNGKQALTMSMGFGCNAAGVIAARVIESPRERLIAIITNNFVLCNGRWPTQILVASIFLGGLVPAHLAGLVGAGAVLGVALLGVGITFAVSWVLSRTVLRGEASYFALELPPYRSPRLLQTIYTSLIDRTLFVLWRAVVFAAPAGAAIWLLGNVEVGDVSLAGHCIEWLDPFAFFIGLNGVILLAYVIAVPANEIVVPTVLMLTVLTAGVADVGAGTGVMFELESASATERLLRAGGWTALTAVNVMLFSLVHNPCSTTIYTIWKETRSVRWALVASLLPVVLGLGLCATTAAVWRAIVS